jgi:hypothetical protein
MNRGGDFSTIYKRDHFVGCCMALESAQDGATSLLAFPSAVAVEIAVDALTSGVFKKVRSFRRLRRFESQDSIFDQKSV